MVEGEDVGLLKQFQDTLFPETTIPLDTVPSITIGGWGGWNQAVGSGFLLKNAAGDGIITYCLFDSDYHPSDAIQARYTEAKHRGISLYIWKQKELENYLLVPSAIHRAIWVQLADGALGPTVEMIETKLQEIAENMKQDVIDCVATDIQNAERKISVATANQKAREVTANRWRTAEERLGVIPGKRALSLITHWVQDEYKVTISGMRIAHQMLASELHLEIKRVLTAIEECEPF